MTTQRIRKAIDDELAATPKFFDFRVVDSQQDGLVWVVEVDGVNKQARLDESFEGSRAWWPTGAAEVLSVIPEDGVLNLRHCTERPPRRGELLRVYPPMYLDSLKNAWQDAAWSAKAWDWVVGLRSRAATGVVLDPTAFEGNLRDRQRQAFALSSATASWLWGPPGTGKTYTLGRMLASYVLQHPSKKVLLVGTTNVAVDQAIVAVDDALASMRTGEATVTRAKLKRSGTRFHPEHYVARSHLLPEIDRDTITKLDRLRKQEPDRRDVQRYAAWKDEKSRLEAHMRGATARLVAANRVVAMTSTRALFELEALRGIGTFDLLVFDESSQVGKAVGAALAPLARSVLFAGDPQQLAPIVQSETPESREWLGKSPFDLQTDASAAVRLNEQSRMHTDICTLVSHLFYGGDLVVAEREGKDRVWRSERRVAEIPAIPNNGRVVVQRVESNGEWDVQMGSNRRVESADWAAGAAAQLIDAGLTQSDVLILTPYRSQRLGIRERLRSLHLRDIQVSTVHRAQGSERHTVIFDITKADNPFLREPDAWRLVNVALSRAKARLVVLMSEWDRTTPLFDLLAHMIEDGKGAVPFERLALKPGFPQSAQGRWIRVWGERDRDQRVRNVVGKVKMCPDEGKTLRVLDALTGEVADFNAPRLQMRAQNAARASGAT